MIPIKSLSVERPGKGRMFIAKRISLFLYGPREKEMGAISQLIVHCIRKQELYRERVTRALAGERETRRELKNANWVEVFSFPLVLSVAFTPKTKR